MLMKTTCLAQRCVRSPIVSSTDPQAAEHGIVVCKALCDVANCELSRNNVPTKDIKICFDEVSPVSLSLSLSQLV